MRTAFAILILQIENYNYLSLLFLLVLFKYIVNKHKNNDPKQKNITAIEVFLSIKSIIDIM